MTKILSGKEQAQWEVNFKTKQFIATSILLLMSENVRQIGFALDPERQRIMWVITALNGFKYKRVVAVTDVEKSKDSFEDIAIRFTASVMAKISGHMKASSIILPGAQH